MMNKKTTNSYEGFRRKNSLKAQEVPGLTSSNQPSLNRIKSKDHLEEIENLSLQLNQFRQRSLSCNNRSEDIPYSSTYFGLVKSPQPMATKNKTTLNPAPELSIQYRSFKDLETGNPTLKKLNSQQKKINGFNEFHIIQEDFISNEDEILEIIVPATIVQTPSTARGTEKKHPSKVNELKSSQNYHKPPASHRTTDNGNSKREKLKQDMSDIQKMQKQLDHHMKKKEPTLKSSLNIRSTKEFPRQSGIKQELNKQGRTTQLYTNPAHKIGLEPKYSRATMKNKTQNDEKGEMTKSVVFQKNTEKQKAETFNSQKKQLMVATKMITFKQKQTLIHQLLSLKEVIDKNQICSNSLPQINAKLFSIQELLTR